MTGRIHPLRGAAVLAAAALFLFVAISSAAQSWRAVNPEIAVGKNVRIEARLEGADGQPIAGPISVRSARLDMGPDGMPEMTARLDSIPSTGPGAVAFETDIAMAGRWRLEIAASVAGRASPVSGAVEFNAVEGLRDRPQAGVSAGERPASDRRILYYRNPMGLPDISPVPKKDPMGMDYIPVYSDETADPPGALRIDPAKVQRAGVRAEAVVRRNISRTVRAAGMIEPDESRLAVVTARFGGFVEELFVSATGSTVRAGQPLLRVWIESTDILQKQADFLTALRDSAGRARDVERAARNLRLFGVPDSVIERLRETREIVRSIVLAAPADGTVMRKPAVVGMRFGAGDSLFGTAELSQVWAMAQVAERDLGVIEVGHPASVTVKAYADAPRAGRVEFIHPELNPATRTAPVRIGLANDDGRLRVGLYVDVEIDVRSHDAVVAIPESAVIDSGSRRVAFVAKGSGVFEPRDLVLGRRGNGFAEVRAGVEEGERVVVSGNFLIDAESNLRAALAAFAPPPAAP